MLCDRPGIEVSRDMGGSDGTQAFLSAVSAPEQLGLNPIRKEHLNSAANKGTSKPKNVVLSNHKRWLHSLQVLKRELAAEEDYMAAKEELKKKKLAEESKKVRDSIRQIKQDMYDATDVVGPHSEQAAVNKDGLLSELKGKFGREVVTEMLHRAQGGAPDSQELAATVQNNMANAAEAQAPRAKSAKQKPAWARTADDEVEDLLEFAENLDIDKYMDDYEFNEALAAAKALITELDEDGAEAGDADETQTVGTNVTHQSTMSQRLREKAAQEESGEQEWDNRTQASHESGRSRISTKSRAVAQEMLEMNPNLRKIHSTKSLAEVVEKMEDDGKGFDPTDQNRFGRCGMGAVRVAVHNDEDRLHRLDVKEGKDLPYLYRNPAV